MKKQNIWEETEFWINHTVPKHISIKKPKLQQSNISKKRLVGYSTIGIILLLFAFFILIPSIQGNLNFFIVMSDSMSPDIDEGDVVITVPTNAKEIQIGDVITFEQSTAVDQKICVTHRVIDIITENGIIQFQTKGDANYGEDEGLVSSSNVIGKVVLTVPKIGYFPQYVKTPIGFLIIIIIPGSLLLISEVRNIIKTQKTKKSIFTNRRSFVYYDKYD